MRRPCCARAPRTRSRGGRACSRRWCRAAEAGAAERSSQNQHPKRPHHFESTPQPPEINPGITPTTLWESPSRVSCSGTSTARLEALPRGPPRRGCAAPGGGGRAPGRARGAARAAPAHDRRRHGRAHAVPRNRAFAIGTHTPDQPLETIQNCVMEYPPRPDPPEHTLTKTVSNRITVGCSHADSEERAVTLWDSAEQTSFQM